MKNLLILLGLMVIISSCSNDEIQNKVELSDANNKEVLREISSLIGETLKNQEVRSEYFLKLTEPA
jgi:uncharacterized membrane protein